jgi:hypothetical protein
MEAHPSSRILEALNHWLSLGRTLREAMQLTDRGLKLKPGTGGTVKKVEPAPKKPRARKPAQKKARAEKALTPTTTREEGGIIRTALKVEGESAGSLDLLDANGVMLARINAFVYRDEKTGELQRTIIDVIDAAKTFSQHKVVIFPKPGQRAFHEAGTGPISADFSKGGAR